MSLVRRLAGVEWEASLGQAVSTAAANGIPVHITGTTSNPVIQADLNQLLQKNAGNILKQQILGNGNNGNKQPNASGRAQALPSLEV